MTIYADPRRCPDCRQPIEFGAESCPSCTLPLSGALAGRLFSTLAQADDLVRALRESRSSAVPPTVMSSQASSAAEARAVPDEQRARSGLSAASVPRILLGLGAVCLLVAALVFLVVTWSVLGVAGRTATLVGFTAVAGGLAAWLARRNLRAAAESLTLVALGLLAFDLLGARDSGWFGDVGTAGFLVLLGAALTVAGGGAALAVRRTPTRVLVGAEVVAAIGIGLAGMGILDSDRFSTSAAITVFVLVAAAGAVLADRLRLGVLATGAGIVSGLAWTVLLITSLERASDHPAAGELWLDLEVWPLLVAAASVGALALWRRLPVLVRVGALATAELVLAGAVLIPFTQGIGTDLTLAVLVVAAVAGALVWVGREPWSWASAVTMSAGAAWLVAVAAELSTMALGRLADTGAFAWFGATAGRLPEPLDGPFAPWLLPLVVSAVIGSVVVVAQGVRALGRLVSPLLDAAAVAGLLVAATIGTVASYPVPVWLVLAMVLTASALFVAWALVREAVVPLACGAVFLAGGAVVSLHDEWLTMAMSVVAMCLGAVVQLRWRQLEVAGFAGGIVAASLAGVVWTLGAILRADPSGTALVALLALAVLALVTALRMLSLESAGVEFGAALSMLVVGLAGVDAAPHQEAATWTAVYLTVAGVATCALSLLRQDRGRLGWLGGLLLAVASWVRLWDVGVETPEAYTVPSALALGVVGLAHLHRDRSASTMTALAPALGLGLIPSLLWVLAEPATLRSLLLGAACLALLVGGVRMRWTAPVLFAATVGGFVVLRHAAPFVDASVPRWALIAATGALLIAMGVTWERRIQEARAVAGYLRGLR